MRICTLAPVVQKLDTAIHQWIGITKTNRPFGTNLDDGVILLLRPKFFSFSFSYLNLVAPVRFK